MKVMAELNVEALGLDQLGDRLTSLETTVGMMLEKFASLEALVGGLANWVHYQPNDNSIQTKNKAGQDFQVQVDMMREDNSGQETQSANGDVNDSSTTQGQDVALISPNFDDVTKSAPAAQVIETRNSVTANAEQEGDGQDHSELVNVNDSQVLHENDQHIQHESQNNHVEMIMEDEIEIGDVKCTTDDDNIDSDGDKDSEFVPPPISRKEKIPLRPRRKKRVNYAELADSKEDPLSPPGKEKKKKMSVVISQNLKIRKISSSSVKQAGIFYPCPKCGRKFFGVVAKQNMERHVRIVHLNIKAFECERCERKFSTKQHLDRHACHFLHNKSLP